MTGHIGQVVFSSRISRPGQVPVLKESKRIFKEYLKYTVPVERDSISVFPRISPSETVTDYIRKVRGIYAEQMKSCLQDGDLQGNGFLQMESKKISKEYLKYTVPVERDSISTFPSILPSESVSDYIQRVKGLYNNDMKSGVPEIDCPESDMTQDQVAYAIALDKLGEKPLSPEKSERLKTQLYQSVRKLIYQIANRYAVNSIDDVEDLAQDCTFRVLDQIWRFDPKCGRFTTWTWWVCRSVLNKKFHIGKKIKNLFVQESQLAGNDCEEQQGSMLDNLPASPTQGVQRHECNGVLANEIVVAVKDLMVQYPKHKALIIEMFGNPDHEDFAIPSYVSVSDAASATGIEYSRARSFYNKVVRPFFRKKFAGC